MGYYYFVFIVVVAVVCYYIWMIFKSSNNKKTSFDRLEDEGIEYVFDAPIRVSECFVLGTKSVTSDSPPTHDSPLSPQANGLGVNEHPTTSSVKKAEVEYINIAPLDLNKSILEGSRMFSHIPGLA